MPRLTSTFLIGERMYSRSVGAVLHAAVLDVPRPPPAIRADWQREISGHLQLEPGDIEPMHLPRTRLRWPRLHGCFEAVAQWWRALGLPESLHDADVALMASRGTPYHHDGVRYGGLAFCNLFLTEAHGAEFHFPVTDHRVPIGFGTAVLFDPSQPHAIVRPGAAGVEDADAASERMPAQVFLSWELPLEEDALARALGVALDPHPLADAAGVAEDVRWDGQPIRICPKTGALLGRS